MARRIAILAANERFLASGDLAPLPGVAGAVHALAEQLRDPDRGDFEVLEFRDATSSEIGRAIDSALHDATHQDTVLIHYAGYLLRDFGGSLHLATADTVVSDGDSSIRATSLAVRQVQEIARRSSSDSVMLVLDCQPASEQSAISDRELFSLASPRDKMRVLVGDYVSTGGRIGTDPRAGVLTRAITSAIATGDADLRGTGEISFFDVVDYLVSTTGIVPVRPEAYRFDGSRPNPLISRTPGPSARAKDGERPTAAERAREREIERWRAAAERERRRADEAQSQLEQQRRLEAERRAETERSAAEQHAREEAERKHERDQDEAKQRMEAELRHLQEQIERARYEQERLAKEMQASSELLQLNQAEVQKLVELQDALRKTQATPEEEATQEDEEAAKGTFRVWYGTNRRPVDLRDPRKGYTADRDTTVHYGTCRVFIPASHEIGSVGSSWWRRIWTWKDDRLRIRSITRIAQDRFWRDVAAHLATLDAAERHALVFIHGYNVSFNDAAIRAAQIGFDLALQGAMAFFSWPSQGALGGYTADEASIDASEFAITDFLSDFAAKSNARAVHIIGHSMGNRGVMRAIGRIAARAERKTGKPFSQIILAAADVDADTFRQFSSYYAEVCARTTLYVSRGDRAVEASRWLHKFPRVGLSPPTMVLPGIDTINVSNVDLTLLGHGYVAEARDVLNDMHALIRHGAPPGERFGVRETTNEEGRQCWLIGA